MPLCSCLSSTRAATSMSLTSARNRDVHTSTNPGRSGSRVKRRELAELSWCSALVHLLGISRFVLFCGLPQTLLVSNRSLCPPHTACTSHHVYIYSHEKHNTYICLKTHVRCMSWLKFWNTCNLLPESTGSSEFSWCSTFSVIRRSNCGFMHAQYVQRMFSLHIHTGNILVFYGMQRSCTLNVFSFPTTGL